MLEQEKILSLNYDSIFRNIEYILACIIRRKRVDDLKCIAKTIRSEIKRLKLEIEIKDKAIETAKELLTLQSRGLVCYPEYFNDDNDIDVFENNAKYILKKMEEIENTLILDSQ